MRDKREGDANAPRGAAGSGRVGSIDVLKFLLALAIVFVHAGQTFGGDSYPLPMGGIAVEAFFVISGCFLCASAQRSAARRGLLTLGEETVGFLWRKVKGVLVPFCVIVVIYFCGHVVGNGLGEDLFVFIPNVTLTFMAGILQDQISIGIVWYVSAMLIAMLAIYPLVRWLGRTYTLIIAPFSALMLMGFMYNAADGVYKGIYEYLTFMPQGLMRAFIGVNLGCVAFELAGRLRDLDLTRLSRGLLAAAVVALGAAVVFVMQWGDEQTCYALVLLLPFLVGILFSRQQAGGSLLDGRVSAYLGRASTYIYFYHAAIRAVMAQLAPQTPYLVALSIMLIGSFAMFVATDLVERLVRRRCAARAFSFSALFVKGKGE